LIVPIKDQLSVALSQISSVLPSIDISQHLSILRQRGVVAARKDGVNFYYSISNPKIIRACNLIREVFMEHLQKDQSVLASTSGRE
jgi:ArsR family transcriptional regulator